MTNSTSKSDKLFLAFGIITIISGILLIIEKDYLIGVSGSCVGAMIAYQNWVKIRESKKK